MIRINLLKPEKKETGLPEIEEKEKKTATLPLFILLAVIIAIVLLFIQRGALKKQNNLIKIAQEEKNKLRNIDTKLGGVNKQKATFMRKISLINQLQLNQDTAVRIMDELSRNIPTWVWLSETTFDGRVVRIRGRALSNKLVSDFIFNLEMTPYFRNVNLISTTQRTLQDTKYQEFSLTATYIPPSKPKPPSEKDKKKEKT